jgi:hypothetical protein
MRTKDEVDTRRGRLPRVETRRDRKALARDAGMGQLSFVSILAGTLSAYGAVAVLLAIAGGIAAAVNSGTDFSNVAWTQLKAGTGIIVALVLLVSYFFGGYVAGRMARRSGVINGVGVFVLGVIIALIVGVLAKQAGAGSSLTTALRNVGAPTTWHEWRDVGTVAGIAALAAMLIGSMLGGAGGDRWHSKLVARAIDPTVGPEAALARESTDRTGAADAAHLDAENRVARTQGRTVEPAVAAAGAGAAVGGRKETREQRLADERVGMADPTRTTAVNERDVDVRDERLAADERAAERRNEPVAAGMAQASPRTVAGERQREREVAAEESAGGAGETRQERVADERAIAAEERTGNGRATVDNPKASRSLMDRLLHR